MKKVFRHLFAALLAAAATPALCQDDGPLPRGPGVNLVYAKCQQCHPIGYVVESAGLPDFLWADTLSLMKQLGMHVTEEEEQTLYSYLTTYLGIDPPPAPEPESADAEVDGAAIYETSCQACHGADGQGVAGAFPPLAGHAAALAQADRGYLPMVLIYGLSGAIDVAGQTYDAVMPPWAQLSDAEIAAVLNHAVTGLGSGAEIDPYTAEEISAARDAKMSAGEVYRRRPELP